jgi:cytochrome c-type biogenesis protein CcmF
MTPELGQIALALALCLSLVLSVVPMLGSFRGDARLMAVGPAASIAQLLFVALAFGLLTAAFVQQDFSVLYVLSNSNSELPMIYRFSAVWGAHEGSMLLWVLVLALWTTAVALFSGQLPPQFRARVLSVLGLVCFGFISFLIFTSNPFARQLPPVLDGNDLNPLLQDPGLIIHPPMLYMGYVGMAVPFAYAVAALIGGQIDQQWVRYCRPWTNVAWAFLTVGIALGSWWAYYELGWGGWWFWDPVENASFMPWLVGAALIHSQAVTEKRGTFRSWTLLLSIAAFSLSLLGTFLVRSGILTSVHAFASDPARGKFVLGMLVILIGGALLLFALRAPRLRVASQAELASKETLLLLNNILLVGACFVVFVGTLYPIFSEILPIQKYSIGAPWFGLMFALFAAPLVLLLPLGAFFKWNGDDTKAVLKRMRGVAGFACAAGVLAFTLHRGLPLKAIIGVVLAFWVLLGTAAFVRKRFNAAPGSRFTLEMAGMVLAHTGVGLWLLGVVLTESLSVERDVAMKAGESLQIGNYRLLMQSVTHASGPNFEADEGNFELYQGDKLITVLRPQKRGYRRGSVMTEAAIHPSLLQDTYIALGAPLDSTGTSWAVRAYHKPFIRFIWLGALLMGFGGILAACERRLRKPVSATQSATAVATVEGARA